MRHACHAFQVEVKSSGRKWKSVKNRNPTRDARAARTHDFAAQKPTSKIERSRRGRCAVLQRPSKKLDSRGTLQTALRFIFMVATTWDEQLSLRSSGKGA